MNVLLTHGYFIAEDSKEQKIMKPYPPLGLLYISAWLEKEKINHAVFDSTFASFAEWKENIINTPPKAIGIYTNLMTKVNVIKMMQFLRASSPETCIILGGPDLRYNIENYLDAGADVLVIGEGEQTFTEVIKTIASGNQTQFGHIHGLAYRDGEVTIKTPEREKIKDINTLPLPNRQKIDMQPYLDTWRDNHGKSAMTVSTQRGCPYTCKWCSTAVYGQSYRRRSPQMVAAELASLKSSYNPDSIWFVDDVFTVSHKWLDGFKEAVIDQDAIIPFECITRADRLNETVIDTLKAAGCFRVWIGAESGSQHVIDLMDRRVDVDHVSDMIKLTQQKGMEAGTFIMLGYPGETEEDIMKTVAYLKDCKPSQFTITIAYPIKGTSMYQEVESDLINSPEWTSSTDREQEFKRTYSRQYYEYAVKWVVNEVNAYQADKWSTYLKLKAKSIVQYTAMRLYK